MENRWRERGDKEEQGEEGNEQRQRKSEKGGEHKK